jgi:hypothetical protein
MTECWCVLCLAYSGSHRRDRPDADAITIVERHGWCVLMVPEHADCPGWTYTVGLWHSFRSPELAMFGLDITVMKNCVGGLAQQATAGRQLVAGQRFDDIVEDRPVHLRPVEEPWCAAFFERALDFYRRPPVPFLQIVWPDRRALFPRQFGSGTYLRQRQPELWRHPDDHPRGVWTAELEPRSGQ